MTQQDTQRLATEFTRLKHDAKRLPIFAWENQDLIAAALTEWAQQGLRGMIAQEEAAWDEDNIRRRALEEAEQVCRARGLGCSPPDDADPDSIVEAQIRASEARACADAIARRAAEGAP